MSVRRRSKALRPSFVIVLATTLAACDVAGDFFGIGDSPTPDKPIDGPCANNGCTNPPPPQPIPPPQPDFGTTITQDKAPPALGAATVIVTADGKRAVVSDTDRDRVVVVDLGTKAVHPIALEASDEPGRLAEDGARQVHVVLHRAGMVATIDLATSKVVKRRAVCAAPQGIARDKDNLFIACADGEIVELPAVTTGEAKVIARLDRDLRDIVVSGESLLISRLRSAEVLRVAKTDGKLDYRGVRPVIENQPGTQADTKVMPFVGWRLVPSGSNGAILVHQMALDTMVNAERPQAYAGLNPCGGSVMTAVTSFESNGSASGLTVTGGSFIGDAVVPVDIARSSDGQHLAIIAAGNGHTKQLPQVHLVSAGAALPSSPSTPDCQMQPSSQSTFGGGGIPTVDPPGQAVATAFAKDTLVVFTREPAALHLRTVEGFHQQDKTWTTITLGGASREDTGHAIFHSNTGGRIACVSCHPSAADDGRVWQLSSGARRTQSLQGTLDGTAPYHWGGDAAGIETFATDVFAAKMGGQMLEGGQVGALRSWLMAIPRAPVAAAVDAVAATRGKSLFESTAVGCTSCHSGAKLTNNESVDVGTGGTFQVPSLLGLAIRAPYLHDGHAATLLDGFGASGGGDKHGTTSTLTAAELKDLVTYLETL